MIDLSAFGYVFDANNSCYFNYFNDLIVEIKTGIDYSYPENPNLNINDYKEVVFALNYIIEKSRRAKRGL